MTCKGVWVTSVVSRVVISVFYAVAFAVFASYGDDHSHQLFWYVPKHFPPACEACGGFGYTGEPYSRCTACKAHPGHAVSFAEWAETRP